MNYKLNLNKLSGTDEIEKIASDFEIFYITNDLSDELLIKLNKLLSSSYKPLLLEIDEYEGQIKPNLEILNLLTNLKILDIIVTNGEIDDLSNIGSIENLESLSLRKNFKKGISLSPISKLKKLKKFELENGLDTKQYSFINLLNTFQELRTSNLDLQKIELQTSLKSLRIYQKLINSQLLNSVLPNIETIYLEKCKDVVLDTSICKLPKLKHVWLRYMNHINSIPPFVNCENIKLFQTTRLAKLEDIENIFEMTNLEALMMTELEVLKFESFRKLANLKNLKIAYVTFKSEIENKKFKAFALEQNWAYLQPALCEEKYDV